MIDYLLLEAAATSGIGSGRYTVGRLAPAAAGPRDADRQLLITALLMFRVATVS